MDQLHQNKQSIAFSAISYVAVSFFVIYWIITLAIIGYPRSLKKHASTVSYGYNLVIRQNWHLFSNPSNYNKQVVFLVRQKNNPSKSDTFNITQYFIKQRKTFAPFNNYYDNLDHTLFRQAHYLETENIANINKLKKQDSTQSNLWYILQSSMITVKQQPPVVYFSNLVGISKQVLHNENISIKNKEFQLILYNNYIPPYKFSLKEYDVQNGIAIPCFISPYYSF